jgi:hypothetical protein
LPEKGYDAASYLVGYEGNRHAYALHLHSLKFIYIEVLCGNKVGYEEDYFYYMRSNASFII